MADDDKGVKPTTPLPVEHSAEPGAVKPGADDAAKTEWTASDRRGPLNSAGDEDIERFVPAHEMDAEGGADPAGHGSIAPDATEQTASTSGEADADTRHDNALRHGETMEAAPFTTSSQDDVRDPVQTGAVTSGEPETKRSLWPVAAGLVVGALIGAGSAWLVYSQEGGGTDNQQQAAALSSRISTLEKRPDSQPEIARLQSGLSDLDGKVAALEKKGSAPAQAPSKAAAPPADSDLAGKVAALQAALDQVKSRTNDLQAQDAKQDGAADKVASLQSGVSSAQKQAASAQSGLDAVKSEQKQLGDKIAGLTIAVAGALKKAETAQTKAEGAQTKADGAQTKAEGATTEVQSVQTQQKALESKLGSPALAVVADSLVQQIDAGRPFTRQVEALAALKADPAKIAVLRENDAHGVPSAQALLVQWKPLADPVIASGNKAPDHANFGQRLEHGLFGLVSVRRADSVTGNDLASRVNQIEADLAHDDVPGAYAVWQALPADAKARSDNWGALAKTSVEALAAARDLQHSAIDALGAKKS